MGGVKQILLIIAVVGQSVLAADEKPASSRQSVIIEKEIRRVLKKPTGELTRSDLEMVRRLSFYYTTKITDTDLKEVAKCKQLTRLNLFRTQITDEGLWEVAKLQQLSSLDLGGTQITDAGLKDLAELQQLEVLGLVGTKVTKAGVVKLQEMLPKCLIAHQGLRNVSSP